MSIVETTEKATVKYLTKRITYVFYKFNIYFLLSVFDKCCALRLINFAVVCRILKWNQISTKTI